MIRAMLAADLDRVIAIADGLPQAPRWGREMYETAVRAGSAPRRIALVAEDEEAGTIIGFAVVSMVLPEAELETIGVAAGQQRRGVGRRLLDEIGRRIQSSGATRVILEVRKSNGAARALYRTSGFEETGLRPSYYADPKEDAIIMAKTLGEDSVSGPEGSPDSD